MVPTFTTRRRVAALLALLALVAAACGGDDDDAVATGVAEPAEASSECFADPGLEAIDVSDVDTASLAGTTLTMVAYD